MPKQRCNKRKQLLTFCITMPAASCTSLFLGCVHDTVYRSHLLFCHTYRLSTLAYTHINTQKPELELHPLTASTVNTAAQCAGHWKQKEEVFFIFKFFFFFFFFFCWSHKLLHKVSDSQSDAWFTKYRAKWDVWMLIEGPSRKSANQFIVVLQSTRGNQGNV